MKLSLQMTMAMALAFAALCLGYAIYGMFELADMADGPAYDDARGFIGFWMFMGAIALASAFAAWRMSRRSDR
jgi:hypothetical protein